MCACLMDSTRALVQHCQTQLSLVQVTSARAWPIIAMDIGLPKGALEVSKICRRRFKAAMLGSFSEVCCLATKHKLFLLSNNALVACYVLLYSSPESFSFLGFTSM